MPKTQDPNRKTTIPQDGIPQIVKWLLQNCSKDELVFMAALAEHRVNFDKFKSILTRLTDYNVYTVFYEKNIGDPMQLMVYRAAKRGEVAGLKAFEMACKAAKEELRSRKEDGDV